MAFSTAASQLLDNNISKFRSREQDPMFHDFQRSLTFSEVMQEIKRLYTIALPMIITGLLMYGKSLISMHFLGRLGKDALAGGSLAMGVANITGFAVISGLASGMEAIASQAFGARQWLLIGQTLQRTVMLLLLTCIPISLLWYNIQPVLLFFNQDPTISSIASSYLTFCLPDLVFQSLINPLKIYLRSQNITFPLIYSAAFALVLHYPINYIVVNHKCLGIQCVALAAAITDFVLLAFLVVYVAWSGNINSCFGGSTLSVMHCFDHEWKSVFTLAVPSCCSVCLEWWWYEIMILLSGILPHAADNVAAMGLLLQATSLIYIFPSALSSAVSTRVGNELGANRPSNARFASRIAMLCAILTSLVAMCFMTGLRNMWGGFYTEDKGIIDFTAAVMPVLGLCELGNCPQTTCCGVLRGSARPRLGANINFLSFYFVGLPMAIFLAFWLKKGLVGLWWGLFAAQIVCTVLMVWALWKTDWVVQAKRASELVGGNNREEAEEE